MYSVHQYFIGIHVCVCVCVCILARVQYFVSNHPEKKRVRDWFIHYAKMRLGPIEDT